MLFSIANNYGPNALGIVLTGMGHDGARGVKKLKKAGGLTIAQNEKSCVIFGMPKVAIDMGGIDKVLSIEKIANEIGVSLGDTEMMMGRMAGSDMSLNARQSDEDMGREWQDLIEDTDPQGAQTAIRRHDHAALSQRLARAMQTLPTREQFILRHRKMCETARTLADLGREMGVSKERVRQLEAAALTKMRHALERDGLEVHDLVS